MTNEAMSDNATRDDIEREYVEAMGPELGRVCAALYHDVVWLHMRWAMYRQLFAKSDRRIALLNDTAGMFFGFFQRVLFEDIVLGLARLVDPCQSKGKDNLSLQRIQKLVKDPQIKSDIRTLTDAAVAACASMRCWRNRRIAHRDLSLALATAAEPLPGISHTAIEEALCAVRDLLNRLELHYCDRTIGYEHTITAPGDGDALVYYLNDGLKATREREQRIRDGTYTAVDLAPDDEV